MGIIYFSAYFNSKSKVSLSDYVRLLADLSSNFLSFLILFVATAQRNDEWFASLNLEDMEVKIYSFISVVLRIYYLYLFLDKTP